MPNYHDWIDKIDIEIDYFSAFIKAWIAFNAWYRSDYSERSDREIIEKIKNESNRFRTYICNYLDGRDKNSLEFQKSIGELHRALANAAITTQERGGIRMPISFTEIALTNPQTNTEATYRVCNYKVQRTGSKVKTEIMNIQKTTTHFSFIQDNYDIDELQRHGDFFNLSDERKLQCLANYRMICPYISESILSSETTAKILGEFGFVNDNIKISRGIVEILYLLRCSLMHGELSPDRNASEVFKYAYEILVAVLKKLA